MTLHGIHNKNNNLIYKVAYDRMIDTMKNNLSFRNLSVEDATETTMEVIGSKQSYALNMCKPNNDDDDDDVILTSEMLPVTTYQYDH